MGERNCLSQFYLISNSCFAELFHSLSSKHGVLRVSAARLTLSGVPRTLFRSYSCRESCQIESGTKLGVGLGQVRATAVVFVDKVVYIGGRDVKKGIRGSGGLFVLLKQRAVRIWNLARHADSEAGCGGHPLGSSRGVSLS